MTTFAYTAIGSRGEKTSGTLSADSKAAALQQVVQKGLHPVSISEEGGKAAAARAAAVPKPGRVPQKAVEAFTRDLANLLSGGVSLARALSLLKREASTPAVKYLWGAVHDDVVGGTALADAMAKFPKSFSSVYVAMVRAGEAGGFLDVVLGQIADFRAREADLKGKVKTALVYPAVLASVAVIVLIVLLTFFIPKFSKMFDDFGGTLPALTQGVIWLSDKVKQDGLFILGGVVVIVILLRRAMKTDAGRLRVEEIILGTPLLGHVIAHFALIRFCRMLGTLVGAGVSLVASLKVAREAIGNQTLSDTVSSAIDQVQRGQPLSKALGESERLFPASVVETIAVAEETGRLDKELVRIAGSFEGDLDRQLRMLVSVLEPLLLMIMAALVGTIVIAMLLPIFSLQEIMNK
jgi:type II secretory pathway component PulF